MDISLLKNNALFSDIPESELREMLTCLQAKEREYKKESYIFYAGDQVHSLAMVLKGSVNIECNDFWGNKTIMNHIAPGQIFAEAYACIPGETILVNAIANEDSLVLFLDMNRVLTTCSNGCSHHHRIIQGLVQVLAQKNLYLSRHILHSGAKTIRGKLLSYLSFQSQQQGSDHVVVPFNRQQMADYLGVDRSALSTEISKLQRDGILKVNRKEFVLLQKLPN